MMKAFLKPKKGLLVRDPVTGRALPAEGAEKPLSPYWLRRIKDGSVIRMAAKAKRAENPEAGEANPEADKED
jgi:hypothetical protein